MTWYYRDGDQEIGPVSKANLRDLIKSGRISGKTMIRSAADSQWRPLAEVVRSSPPGAQPQPAPNPDHVQAAAAPLPSPAMPTAVCSQCGRSFPEDQVVVFDGQTICAACKPIFVQRLREGVFVPGTFKYGGFWIRVGAKLIDGLVLAAAQYAILIPLSFLTLSSYASLPANPQEFDTSGMLMIMAVQWAVALILPAVYNIFFIGRFGATIGKMACRLKVTTPEGGKISYLRATGRHFAEFVTYFTFTIGYIIAGFDKEKRTLHDRIASTRVVHR